MNYYVSELKFKGYTGKHFSIQPQIRTNSH